MMRRLANSNTLRHVLATRAAVSISRPSVFAATAVPISRISRSFCSTKASEPIPETIPEEAIETNETNETNEKEVITGPAQSHEFQTQTRKILDIVARSLYSDRDIFLRELISNSADALEKLRHLRMSDSTISTETPARIILHADTVEGVLTIQDFGIGMTEDELKNNLGTIAKSGSEDFAAQLLEKGEKSADIIGRFGVGFYSVFMVADNVRVFTRGHAADSIGYCWSSDGSGSYSIAQAEGVSPGTKIVLKLKSDCKEYCDDAKIESIVRSYSNFVPYDIYLGSKKLNTVKAIWALPKDKVTDDEHREFYQFISRAYDDPHYKLHYGIDVPIALTALFYIPSRHMEKFGMGKMESGISLFSRKVLIQSKCDAILPDWLRFIRGVVDSPEIQLNLSREHLQNSGLIKQIGSILTRRILKYLQEEAESDPEKYIKFFTEFGNFIKEGCCTDMQWKFEVSKLLRYETSTMPKGTHTSLEEYASRMRPDQKSIFYLCAPNREIAEASPYIEGFKKKGIEVLYLYQAIDSFVMSNLVEYKSKKLISVETSSKETEIGEGGDDAAKRVQTELMKWLKQTLFNRVSSIRKSDRLVSSPAIVVDHESSHFRKMMMFSNPQNSGALPKQILEINVDHPIMKMLDSVRIVNQNLAEDIANQIMDNALISAGLMDDARSIIPRMNRLMEAILAHNAINAPTEHVAAVEEEVADDGVEAKERKSAQQ